MTIIEKAFGLGQGRVLVGLNRNLFVNAATPLCGRRTSIRFTQMQL